jgi:monoamine oxidase
LSFVGKSWIVRRGNNEGGVMARTRLLRALQQLAREHRQADELGISPDELRERAAETRERSYSRGELLKRAGAVGGAIALGGPAALARNAWAASAPRVVIVGGGIAGLTTALMLQDKGVYSEIYESSGRVGGRMHSDWTEFGNGFWDNGQQAELCGELIDSNHKTILQLAQRFSLRTVDLLGAQPNGSEDTYWIFGAGYPKDEADKDFQPVHNTLQGQVQATSYPTLYNNFTSAGQFFDGMTIYDWIANYVPGGHSSRFGALLNAAYNEEYGAETTEQSALNLMYLLGFNTKPGNFSIYGKSDERYHIVGGNSLLPVAIANALPSESIHLNSRMTSIKTNADGTVTMTFDTGGGTSKTVTADHVVLCMSFSVLRTLDYRRAGFDPLKQTAITQLGSGINAKLNVQFESRIWNSFGSTGSLYSDLPFQSGWEVTRGQSAATGIFVEYPGANVAKSMGQSTPYSTSRTNAQVVKFTQQLLKQLEPVFPGITNQWNGKAMLSTPFTDPNFLCSYSYWKPGQYTGFSGYEKMRQGNIHFAGEHCSQDFQGFMEGGASEGVRAASEILADLKKA